MSSLIFTQTDLDNLKAAFVSGALRVKIGDREVIYRSQKEIVEAIRTVTAYLDGINTTTTPNLIQAKVSKGQNKV